MEYYRKGNSVLYNDDAENIDKLIKPNSVHTVVTSPPYWGKAIYFEDDNQLGLDKTPDEYIERLVNILRGIKKVLHPTGTVWLNIGDTNCVPSTVRETRLGMKPGVPAKNRIGIPWRTALALQKDGWWLRADIIWYRTNSPREPVKDRPTYEHEYIFLLTKKANYYYNQAAVFQDLKAGDHYAGDRNKITIESGGMFKGGHNRKAKLLGRNLGSVWAIPTEPRTDPHYAAFPSKLVSRCIRAGTSSKGCCSECGAPYKEIFYRKDEDSIPKSKGWEPTCKCNASIVPCVVLDPFMGRGTTALVAKDLGRDWIGIEKDEKSCKLIADNVEYRSKGLLPPTKIDEGLIDPKELDGSIIDD